MQSAVLGLIASALQNPVAVVLVRPGEDSCTLIEGLADTLGANTELQILRTEESCTSVVDMSASLACAAGSARLAACFELSFARGTSMPLMECCTESGVDLYRWQAGAAMFKRLHGNLGPAWIAAGSEGAVSEDIEIEQRGWGYLSGDEEPVVDTAALSDDEIARLLDLPAPVDTPHAATHADGDETAAQPSISSLGYRLVDPTSAPPVVPAAAPLTPRAYEVLLCGATEPQGSFELADGAPFPPEGVPGLFVSPVSGAPLLAASQLRTSTTGWPAFAPAVDAPTADGAASAASAALAADCAQHLRRTRDVSGGVVRIELVERGSGGSHLGHDFEASLCINAASLLFVPSGSPPPSWLLPPPAPALAAALAASPSKFGELRVATLAAGCFWRVRRKLCETRGVCAALCGFTGGDVATAASRAPTYEDVCAGGTGHVEAVQVAYEPSLISYESLLEVYWGLVPDVAASYRQGVDVGPQYEPAIFYHSAEQRAAALATKERVQAALDDAAGAPRPGTSTSHRTSVMTRVRPAAEFWPAAEEHQRDR